MQWQHRSWAGFSYLHRCLVLLWKVQDTLGGQICIWQIQHMDYMGPFWSNGWRAEVWLSIVPNTALSSSSVARKGHLGSWCSLGSAGCPRPGCSQVCAGILEMLQHLKWCWALRRAQLHLVPSASQSYQNAACHQKWGSCVLLTPQHTQMPWNQAQVKQINYHCARESLQYP